MTKNTTIEITKFALAGGSVAILHLAFVYFLTSVLGFWYLLSSVVSYICAIILNFALQKFFVRQNLERSGIEVQFFHYTLVSSVMLLLNILLMYIFVSVFSVYYLLAQGSILFVLSGATFYINRCFIFR
jgi:putative flippase GtrA